MSSWSIVLLAWTAAAVVWWSLSLVLVRSGRPRRPPQAAADLRRLSIFKPLAGLTSAGERDRVAACLESFVAQLDARSELLLGIEAPDRGHLAPLIEALRRRYPGARLRVIVLAGAAAYPNKKVAVLETLARHATGELWLWSDADMVAPPGSLMALRRDFAAGGAHFVTVPYALRRAIRPVEILDKLFVNLEIHPGALLLGRLDAVRFGFGAGILFEAARFHRCVSWAYLGTSLADDYHLGRLLGRGRLASTRFLTISGSRGWRDALLHYMRWQKTIRWCRPGSYAAQLLVLPVIGWLFAVLATPGALFPWLGLAATVCVDVTAARGVCTALAAPIAWRHLPVVTGWSLLRSVVWLACWLPWPIVWRGRKWWSPRQLVEPRAARLAANHRQETG